MVSVVAAKRFTVELERVGKTATMFRVPFGLEAHRREYVEWVEEGKRPETRARRIAATVERIRPGARRR
jgi:uncharacterized protein YdeI (YjbR/CyaY-like superfamily)